MFALLDVGNTSISYTMTQNGKIRGLKTHKYSDIPKIIKKIASSGGNSRIDVILSSVVPEISALIKKSVKRYKHLKLWVAGSNLPLKINHKYIDIKQLGIDRQVNIIGAQQLYGVPALIIDFGTAITADFVSGKGVFEGGMIIPGPELAFQALIRRAARISSQSRLPKSAARFLGTSTQACINSGILEGYGAMTDGLILRFRHRCGKKFKVIVTGGFSAHLKPFMDTTQIDIIDPLLSVKSLFAIFKDFNS